MQQKAQEAIKFLKAVSRATRNNWMALLDSAARFAYGLTLSAIQAFWRVYTAPFCFIR